MNDFYKKQIETETKQLFYWLKSATNAIANGESAVYSTLCAAEHAASIDKYCAFLRASGKDNLNWGAIARNAYIAALDELNNKEQ